MTTLNQNYMVSLEEAAQLTARVRGVTHEWVSEPGNGKTTFATTRVAELAGIAPEDVALIDCASMELGDGGLPWVNHENKTSGFYPSERFGLHHGRPVLIVLDELSKSSQPTQNMLQPLIETHKRRFYNIPLPDGSIVCMTGNLSTDGVGDSQLAHTKNRRSRLYVRRATAAEWIQDYAIPKGLNAGLITFVHETPRIMASYRDPDQDENPYIFHPTKMQEAYASPRSLSQASHIIEQRGDLSHNAVMADLAGTIGLAAAHDLEAFIRYQDSLPPRDSIINDPKNARLPDAGAACYVLVFNLVVLVDATNINPIITYVNRLPAEFQSVFFLQVAKNKDKQKIAFRNDLFKQWLLDNEDLL